MLKVGTIVDIRRLRDDGLSKSQVARRLGLNCRTVDRYWDGPTESPEAPEYKERTSVAAPWMEYVEERLQKYPELSARRPGPSKQAAYALFAASSPTALLHLPRR